MGKMLLLLKLERKACSSSRKLSQCETVDLVKWKHFPVQSHVALRMGYQIYQSDGAAWSTG